MNNDKLKCPKCGHDIAISDILKQRLTQQVQDEVAKRLAKEKEQLAQQLAEEQKSQLKQMEAKLVFEEKKRQEAEAKELELIKKQTELADKLKNQELVIARKLQEERKTIEEKARAEEQEKQNFIILEMRKQLEDTKKSLIDAQRKAQQGSMQTQGEVTELSLEETLKANFVHDEIKPVPKGIAGADVIQNVHSRAGQFCGIIAWESKRTKAWTEEWVDKLKDDGRQIKANILVLASEVLPKNIKHFGFYKGIWVTDFASVLGLATAIRQQLMAVAQINLAQQNKEDKKDVLYNYLTSPAFASKIETIAENYNNMKLALEKEKQAMTKIWAVREVQLNRLTETTVKMYGEISGIAGAQLPAPEILALEEAVEIKKNDKNDQANDQINLF